MHDRRLQPVVRPVDRVALSVVAVAASVLFLLGGDPLWRTVRVAVVLGLAFGVARALANDWPGARTGAALLGLVAVAAGAGLAVPHVSKAGDTMVILTGVALVLGGTTLAVRSLVTSVQRRRSWRRGLPVLLALPMVFVAAQIVTVPVAATNVPRTSLDAMTPADRGLAFVDATVPTADGVTLSGWYVPSTSGGAVVLLHGSGSTRSSTLEHAVVLARHGYGVLLLDARGHGRSGGRAMDLGWYGDADVSAAVDWLSAQAGVDGDRVGAVGLSMGGEEAIGAAAADARIAAVVAEGATGRVADDFDWLSDEYGLRGQVQEGIEALRQVVTDQLTDASAPISLRAAVAATAPRPVLLVAAGNVDEEVAASAWIQAGAPDTVQLWVVAGSGHTQALDTAAETWEARVVGFLDDALRDERGSTT